MFRRNIFLPSSLSMSKPSKQPAGKEHKAKLESKKRLKRTKRNKKKDRILCQFNPHA
jgi:hypothetical protein